LETSPGFPFHVLRQTVKVPPFEADGLDVPADSPRWADFEPQQPGAVGRVFGGAGRYFEGGVRQEYLIELLPVAIVNQVAVNATSAAYEPRTAVSRFTVCAAPVSSVRTVSTMG
jgi:hypothetical protein